MKKLQKYIFNIYYHIFIVTNIRRNHFRISVASKSDHVEIIPA